ncbi:histone H1-like repetitive region-containing protein [Kitasatospora sp. NPDC049258]|uniref:histone H1-like repetitive region-containing protein n=1 Tax=Kitasatospora sp. NPDC049258 TaxID=3155394 RepID=UPI003443DAB9
MLRDAVRGAVAVATAVAEETGRRVLTTATGLLERGGVDVAAVERVIAEQFPPSGRSLQSLTQEAFTVGRAGVDLAVGVARSEAERIFERVGDQVMKVGVVLSFLESQLRDTEEQPVAEQPDGRAPGRPAPRAEGLFEAGWDDEEWGGAAEEVPADAWAVPEPAEPVTEAPARPASAKSTPTANGRAAGGSSAAAAGKAPEEKAPAKKASAKKASAKKAPAENAASEKAPAKKTTTKKTVARKTVATGTEARKPAARKGAAKKTVVRKATSARSEPEPGADG